MRFGSEVYRFIFAAKPQTAEIDRPFRESVGSFRRMSAGGKPGGRSRCAEDRARSARGDTVERLAGRMAVPDRPVERFRVLNGLAADERVRPASGSRSWWN